MNKKLVAYFSASGVTKRVAKQIAEIVHGDVLEIEPVEKYTDDDLNWNDQQSLVVYSTNNYQYIY